jgi:hypothetical protein
MARALAGLGASCQLAGSLAATYCTVVSAVCDADSADPARESTSTSRPPCLAASFYLARVRRTTVQSRAKGTLLCFPNTYGTSPTANNARATHPWNGFGVLGAGAQNRVPPLTVCGIWPHLSCGGEECGNEHKRRWQNFCRERSDLPLRVERIR